MHKLEQDKQISKSFTSLTYINSKQNYNSRAATMNLYQTFHIPQSNTATCETFSHKNQCIKDQYHLKKTFKNLYKRFYKFAIKQVRIFFHKTNSNFLYLNIKAINSCHIVKYRYNSMFVCFFCYCIVFIFLIYLLFQSLF